MLLSILHQETVTQKFVERSELGKFLAKVSKFRRQGGFNLSPLPLASMRAARLRLEIDYSHRTLVFIACGTAQR